MDCLLFEGSTVLYRVGLALLARAQTAILQCRSQNELEAALGQHNAEELIADDLLKAAWVYHVKHEHLVRDYGCIVNDLGALNDVDEKEMDIIHLPILKENSAILSPEQVSH